MRIEFPDGHSYEVQGYSSGSNPVVEGRVRLVMQTDRFHCVDVIGWSDAERFANAILAECMRAKQ